MVHLHNPYPLISPWVIRTARAYGVPVVHTVHNYRQVCASGVYFRDGAPLHRLQGARVRAARVVHSCYRDSKAQSAVMATALAVHRPTWRGVARFVALTSQIEEHLRRVRHPGGADRREAQLGPRSRAAHERSAADSSSSAGSPPRRDSVCCSTPGERIRTGSLGELRIAGDGPLRGLAEQAAADRRDVVYLGHPQPFGVRDAIRAAAVTVTPSTWHDVLPTVILEALANARPVLGSTLGGIPYLIGTARVGGRALGRGARRRAARRARRRPAAHRGRPRPLPRRLLPRRGLRPAPCGLPGCAGTRPPTGAA